MKIIEGMKAIKSKLRKCEDLREKIDRYSADLDYQNPVYDDQGERVQGWLTQHHDLILEITHLKSRIQATNLATELTITIGDDEVTRPIAEWVIRRRELISLEIKAWGRLTDRGLEDGRVRLPGSDDLHDVRVRRYFSPDTRDRKIEELKSELEDIDAKLEIANATTDLVDL